MTTPRAHRRHRAAVPAIALAVAACATAGVDPPGTVAPDGGRDGDAPAAAEVEVEVEEQLSTSDSNRRAGVAMDWPAGEEWFTTGFLDFPLVWFDEEVAAGVGEGFSMYVAAWPLQAVYPGPDYQTGLPSTWLYAARLAEVDAGYSTIEGGLGWWNDTRFATEAPKFIMGGVSRDFTEWANGPGAGAGTADVDRRDWDVPQGKYGVAQLSPYVLWAPDGLNLAQDTDGELFGYGYHPLPLFDAREDTRGTGVATGDRAWTLFLQTATFAGPVSVFVPDFFSKPAVADPAVEGQYLDSLPMDGQRAVSMETQVIPSAHAVDDEGVSWARITRTQFPVTDGTSSIILDSVASYRSGAMWDPVTAWFDGGAVPSGEVAADQTLVSRFDDTTDPLSSWTIIHDGIDETEEYPVDWSLLAEVDTSEPTTFRYRWNLDVVTRDGGSFVLPEFYRLTAAPDGPVWVPVAADEVPDSTGLADHVFPGLGTRADDEPYTTPTEPDSVWRSPGPVAGPFRAELGDGSVVTYSWYRFVDQPAIIHWDLDDAHRAALQSRVEAIHRAWGPDGTYLAPPTTGELARLDPAVLVTPPAGLEAGFVPVVTRQERADG